MNMTKWLSTLFIVLGLSFGMTACENDGPMEEAGEEADEAIEDMQQKADEACDEVTGENC